jgi:hypothetical protein
MGWIRRSKNAWVDRLRRWRVDGLNFNGFSDLLSHMYRFRDPVDGLGTRKTGWGGDLAQQKPNFEEPSPGHGKMKTSGR